MIKIERYYNGNLKLEDILNSIIENKITECLNDNSNTNEISLFVSIDLKEVS